MFGWVCNVVVWILVEFADFSLGMLNCLTLLLWYVLDLLVYLLYLFGVACWWVGS